LDSLRALVPVAEPLTLVGGGAKSALWRQIYADVYGLRVVRTEIGQQAAALGAAAVAGVGCGLWPDFGIVDRVTRVINQESPDAKPAAEYARLYARYRSLTAHLATWAQE
ncbi:MAG: pentose kinase, partial [Kiritimatiellae bacterium]|nr:pentose kinase [Kiritimatiellia bacterium]